MPGFSGTAPGNFPPIRFHVLIWIAAAIRAALELKLHDSRSHDFGAGVAGGLFTVGWIAARGFEAHDQRALLGSRCYETGAVRP